MPTLRDRDPARLAELRRQARAAQGRPDDPADETRPPAAKWSSGAGEIQRVAVGLGQQVITVEAAAHQLGMTVDQVRSRAQVVEVGGWAFLAVELAEVERLAQ